MEALEKAHLRNEQRLDKNILKPVEVRTLNDIKRIISIFDPNKNEKSAEIPINTLLEDVEDGKKVTYHVSAITKSKSKRDILIEGFESIERRQKIDEVNDVEPIMVNGKEMKLATINSNTNSYSWVDPLIKQWTGGVRKGTLITWDIGDGYEYRYQIFTHNLTRIQKTQ